MSNFALMLLSALVTVIWQKIWSWLKDHLKPIDKLDSLIVGALNAPALIEYFVSLAKELTPDLLKLIRDLLALETIIAARLLPDDDDQRTRLMPAYHSFAY